MNPENQKYSDKLAIIATQNIKERDYWLAKLSEPLERIHFPYDNEYHPGETRKIENQIPQSSKHMDNISFRFSKQLFDKSMKLSGGLDLKLHMILTAGLMILLEKYTSQKNIMIGSPILKQDTKRELINKLLIFRNRVEKSMTFKQLLLEVRETIINAADNQNYPLVVLIDQLKLPVIGSESPFFDVALLLENLHDISYIQDIYRSITFSFRRTDQEVQGDILYDSRLYLQNTIRRISDHLIRLLDTALENVNIPLGEIDMLLNEEKNQLLSQFNRSLTSIEPREVQALTLDEALEKQVKTLPDHIALVYSHHQISYRTLNESSHQLAHLLKQKSVGPDTIVALWLPPSIRMMIGELGILKSGGAYLPIALDAPPHRVRFILKDSNTRILLTTSDLIDDSKMGSWEGETVFLSTELNNSPSPQSAATVSPSSTLTCQVSPANLAYLIYTSGTTGRPKGTAVEHRQVMAYLDAFYREFDVSSTDTVLQLAPYSFDVFIEEVYSLLLKGGKIIIPNANQIMDIRQLSTLILKHRVSIIDCTPLLLNEFNKQTPELLGSVRLFISGGDILKEEYITNLSQIAALYNTYGPTETTVCATYYRYSSIPGQPIPIGKPIIGYYVNILDEMGQMQPIGTAGEICISGSGVTRGYLNRPELTAEKFCLRRPGALFEKTAPGPRKNFSLPHSPTYRTGDRGRWLVDGNIEFLGRIDLQVKIRGYRIETEEIENQLVKTTGIKQAAVIARQDKEKEKYLCAYVVPEHRETLEKDYHQWSAQLRQYLLDRLPDYMIPSFFVSLERLPLTANGKINRKALPEPEIKSSTEYIAPRNPVEKRLVQIWQEIFGLEKIGVTDDFFDLGGHSLWGIRISNEIHKYFEIEIQFIQVFQERTIEKLAQYIKKAREEKFVTIKPVEKKEYYPLSSPQRRLYILYQMVPGSIFYNMPMSIPLGKNIDNQLLEQAFKQLIQRHDSLRTSFEMIHQQPAQRIHKQVPFQALYFDSRPENEESRQAITPLPFDLSTPPLIRIGLLKEKDNYILLMDMHHIITDGVSMNILQKEFIALYAGKLATPLKLQYKDYSQWQNSKQQKKIIERQEEYWLKTFEGELAVLELPIDYQRPLMQNFEGGSTSFHLDNKEFLRLKEIAAASEVTLYMMVFSIYNIFLSKMSGQEDIIIGAPVAGRNHPDLHSIMGMFVNTLAMRNYPSPEKSFADFLNEIKQNTMAAFENQDYPFEDLVEKILVKRDTGRNPVFDVVFNWGNQAEYRPQTSKTHQPISSNDVPREVSLSDNHWQGISKFDLNFTVIEDAHQLTFEIVYCTKLFKPETIKRFISYFRKIIGIVVENPKNRIAEIDILSKKEKHQLLVQFNQTTTEYPRDKTIHRLFAEQAEQTPDKIAVIGPSQLKYRSYMTYRTYISYNELNEQTNQLAHLLQKRGVGTDSIVGIMIERSLEMIIGILGILKAGAAYLPIETEYPQERIDYMLKDSGAKILLTSREIPNLSSPEAFNNSPKGTSSFGIWNLEFGISSQEGGQLAYIIYTSGTTGKPKGTLTTHYNVIRVVKNTNYINLTGHDRLLQLSNYAFDGSVFDIFGALLNGAALVMIKKEDVLAVNQLAKLIRSQQVTVFFVTTAMFNTLVQLGIDCLHDVRKILFGGERISIEHTQKALDYLGSHRIIHVYGPTETTVYAAYYFINSIDETRPTIPIGQPISNTTVYILDNCIKLVPIGVTGELYIGGEGTARGYLNNPELTAEKFDHDLWDYHDYQDGYHRSYKSYRSYISKKKVPDKNYMQSCIHASMQYHSPSPHYPIPPLPHSHIYRTGDRTRWLLDGNIEFIGRIDQQVKIRGFRIELGEIESQLRNIESVKETVVIAYDDNTNQEYLCAYIVSDVKINPREIKNTLSQTLPGYMIPAYFHQLDKMPLTSNGKIQQKALPLPQVNAGTTYAPPGSEIETKLVEIWSEILSIKKEIIGIHDDFFQIGGQSLKATMLAAKIHEVFDVDIPIGEIFKTPTIKEIAQLISVTGWIKNPQVDNNDITGEKEEIVL